MTASQRAMATAVIYPDPRKGGVRKKRRSFLEKDAPDTSLLAKARAVLGTEFVTPILEGSRDAAHSSG
jgi:hypothetical protein